MSKRKKYKPPSCVRYGQLDRRIAIAELKNLLKHVRLLKGEEYSVLGGVAKAIGKTHSALELYIIYGLVFICTGDGVLLLGGRKGLGKTKSCRAVLNPIAQKYRRMSKEQKEESWFFPHPSMHRITTAGVMAKHAGDMNGRFTFGGIPEVGNLITKEGDHYFVDDFFKFVSTMVTDGEFDWGTLTGKDVPRIVNARFGGLGGGRPHQLRVIRMRPSWGESFSSRIFYCIIPTYKVKRPVKRDPQLSHEVQKKIPWDIEEMDVPLRFSQSTEQVRNDLVRKWTTQMGSEDETRPIYVVDDMARSCAIVNERDKVTEADYRFTMSLMFNIELARLFEFDRPTTELHHIEVGEQTSLMINVYELFDKVWRDRVFKLRALTELRDPRYNPRFAKYGRQRILGYMELLRERGLVQEVNGRVLKQMVRYGLVERESPILKRTNGAWAVSTLVQRIMVAQQKFVENLKEV